MGGSVEVDSQIGEGSSFSINIKTKFAETEAPILYNKTVFIKKKREEHQVNYLTKEEARTVGLADFVIE